MGTGSETHHLSKGEENGGELNHNNSYK